MDVVAVASESDHNDKDLIPDRHGDIVHTLDDGQAMVAVDHQVSPDHNHPCPDGRPDYLADRPHLLEKMDVVAYVAEAVIADAYGNVPLKGRHYYHRMDRHTDVALEPPLEDHWHYLN